MRYSIYMLKKLISLLSLPVIFTSLSFAQTTSFEELQPMSAGSIQAAMAVPGAMPADKKYGVSYTLTGVLSIHEEKVLLNTPDGRLFELDMSVRKARKLEGQSVQVEAKAKQADDMAVLKINSIAPYDASQEIVLPGYIARQRPAALVSETDEALVVNNMRWLYGQTPSKDSFDWTTATIKPALIKSVYFIKKPFAPEWIAAHSLLVFNFEKGGLTDANGNEAKGFVVSIEAYLREGQNYGLVSGMKKQFGIVWTLATWEDYSSRTALFGADDNRLIPYPIEFTHEQEVQMVREAVKLATVNRQGEYYDTITNNCTNNLVIIMDHAMPANKRIKMWTIPYLAFNLRATMPVWVPGYLQKKGLLGKEMPKVDASNYQVPLP